jgi:hypothetical protein
VLPPETHEAVSITRRQPYRLLATHTPTPRGPASPLWLRTQRDPGRTRRQVGATAGPVGQGRRWRAGGGELALAGQAPRDRRRIAGGDLGARDAGAIGRAAEAVVEATPSPDRHRGVGAAPRAAAAVGAGLDALIVALALGRRGGRRARAHQAARGVGGEAARARQVAGRRAAGRDAGAVLTAGLEARAGAARGRTVDVGAALGPAAGHRGGVGRTVAAGRPGQGRSRRRSRRPQGRPRHRGSRRRRRTTCRRQPRGPRGSRARARSLEDEQVPCRPQALTILRRGLRFLSRGRRPSGKTGGRALATIRPIA